MTEGVPSPIGGLPSPFGRRGGNTSLFVSAHGVTFAQTAQPFAVGDFSVGDLRDSGLAEYELLIEFPDGTFSVSPLTGLTFIQGDGTDDALMQYQGTVSALLASLAGLTLNGLLEGETAGTISFGNVTSGEFVSRVIDVVVTAPAIDRLYAETSTDFIIPEGGGGYIYVAA